MHGLRTYCECGGARRRLLSTHRSQIVPWRGAGIMRESTNLPGMQASCAAFSRKRRSPLDSALLIQNGASQRALLEAGGWKSERMVRRYAQLSATHLWPTAKL